MDETQRIEKLYREHQPVAALNLNATPTGETDEAPSQSKVSQSRSLPQRRECSRLHYRYLHVDNALSIPAWTMLPIRAGIHCKTVQGCDTVRDRVRGASHKAIIKSNKRCCRRHVLEKTISGYCGRQVKRTNQGHREILKGVAGSRG